MLCLLLWLVEELTLVVLLLMLCLLLWLVEELILVVLLLMLGLLLWLVEELTLVIDFASVSTISLLSDGIVTLVEQELLTLPEHLNSPPDFSGVRVTRSLVLYVCFVDRCLSFCTFFLPLCCLFFFDIRFLIAPLVSSNSFYINTYNTLNSYQLHI